MPPICPPGPEVAAPAIDDPELYVPGSFDDVVRAYDLGWLSDPTLRLSPERPRTPVTRAAAGNCRSWSLRLAPYIAEGQVR